MSLDRVYKPSEFSYQGSTQPLDPTHCHYDVWPPGRSITHHQCQRGIWKDKWCKQHHPDTIAARDQAQADRYKREVTDPIHRDEARHRCVKLAERLLTEWWYVSSRSALPPTKLMKELGQAVRKAKPPTK